VHVPEGSLLGSALSRLSSLARLGMDRIERKILEYVLNLAALNVRILDLW
jgi:hypothetical protein